MKGLIGRSLSGWVLGASGRRPWGLWQDWAVQRLRPVAQWPARGMGIYKTAAIGQSAEIASVKALLQPEYFFLGFFICPPEGFGQGYCAMLVGQIAGVEDLEAPTGEKQIARHVDILDQRLADIVHLAAPIAPLGVGQKADVAESLGRPGNVEQLARWRSPDGVKFCFDIDAGQCPQGPAQHLLAALGCCPRRHHGEALVLDLIEPWLAAHAQRLQRADRLAKSCQVFRL